MSSKLCIDLLKGSPATALLPTQRLSDAAVSALSKPEVFATGLDYGPDEGHLPLRIHLAEWLTGYYKPSQPIQADRICVTGGASQNLANILQVFTDPSQTRYIWMPLATYHLAFRIFEDAGFYRRLRAVPENEEGMDMGFLEHALANDEAVAERVS
jgi:DNA-binding transcriptional MocR family regulator